MHTRSAKGLVDIQCVLVDHLDWFDKSTHLFAPTRTRVKLMCSGSSRVDTFLPHHIPIICKMNSRNRKHLVVLLLLLVCTGRTDAFFRTFKDWFDKLTPSNEECTKDWISFDGRGVGKGRIKH